MLQSFTLCLIVHVCASTLSSKLSSTYSGFISSFSLHIVEGFHCFCVQITDELHSSSLCCFEIADSCLEVVHALIEIDDAIVYDTNACKQFIITLN